MVCRAVDALYYYLLRGGQGVIFLLVQIVIIIILLLFRVRIGGLVSGRRGRCGPRHGGACVFYIGMQRCLEMAMMDSLLYTSVRI
ncbi:hypothetical protein J3E68DRAFT_400118 [Trichoderma sp. SZMC 28012]